MELTAVEAIAVRGLVEREQAIERDAIAPLRADYAAVFRAVEARLGLDAGAIGNGHTVDLDTGRVVPIETVAPETAPTEPIG